MKLKFALVGLVALGSATLVAGVASAMPLAALGQSLVSDVENVAVACGPNGCIRTAPSTDTVVMVFAGMAMVTHIAAADTATPMAITGAIADTDERGYGPFFMRSSKADSRRQMSWR